MSRVVVFHHARGLTAGVRAFADVLRGLGHEVFTPDLFDGRVFDSLDDGVAHAESIGFEALAERGAAAAPDGDIVVIGFSLGALPAQRLAQTRAEVGAAVLCHSAIPLGWFGDEWPHAVPLRIHMCDEDPWAAEDRDAALAVVEAAADGELVLHRGAGHLVADPTDDDHDPVVAAVMLDHIVRLLDVVDSGGRRDEFGRPEPRSDAGELTTDLGFLEYQRATFDWKCRGVDAAGMRATVGSSVLTLGGLVKHMALVEASWFRRVLLDEGRQPPWADVDWDATPDWDFDSAADDTPDDLFELWEAAVADARWGLVVALSRGGLEQKAEIDDDPVPSLRWIVLHMVEEYARHNGHADLLREAVDGSTGE